MKFRSCVIGVFYCRGRAAARLKGRRGNMESAGGCERGSDKRAGKVVRCMKMKGNSRKVAGEARNDNDRQSRILLPCFLLCVKVKKLVCSVEKNWSDITSNRILLSQKEWNKPDFQEMSSGEVSPCIHSSSEVKVPDNTCMETANQTHPRQSRGALTHPCNTRESPSAHITGSDRSAAMCSCACIIIPDHRSVQHLHVVTSNGLDVKLHYLALSQKPLSSLPGGWFLSPLASSSPLHPRPVADKKNEVMGC